jgi:Mn-dependent DtxR family transcriptional regulator
VSKSSAHSSAVRELQAENPVTTKKYRNVYLTAEGHRQTNFMQIIVTVIEKY